MVVATRLDLCVSDDISRRMRAGVRKGVWELAAINSFLDWAQTHWTYFVTKYKESIT